MNFSEFDTLFRTALTDNGLKYTRQRAAILNVVYHGEKHMTLDEILEIARKEYPKVGYATVYRTMKLLHTVGLVEEHKFTDGQARYEKMSTHHHDHMICVTCGKITEFEDELIERRQHQLATDMGFVVVDHKHEIYVKCNDDQCGEA